MKEKKKMRERKEKLCFQERKTEEEKINKKKEKQVHKRKCKTIVTFRKDRKQEKEKR